LKPENLVLEEEENILSNIKIIDFGTSKILNPNETIKELTGTAYYIAPEVIGNNYNYKCDIWSCGVIMFVLLTGTIPFAGKSNEEIMKKVKIGIVKYNNPIWNKISNDAKDLLKLMLAYNPSKRITAEEALNSIWIVKHSHKFDYNFENLSLSLNNLRTFRAHINFQRAALSFIAKKFTSKDEEKRLRDVFTRLDSNNDGQLSRDELIEGFKLTNSDEEAAIRRVDRIMKNIDLNKNNSIDYNG